jgi:tellurite resistance protein TerC
MQDRHLITFFLFLIGLLFSGVIFYQNGAHDAKLYLIGFLLEKALSIDNLLVILLIFKALKIPDKSQPRLLFWGFLGAILLRGIFILGGTALIHRFHFLLYFFGLLLIGMGSKFLFSKKSTDIPFQITFIQQIKNFLPLTSTFFGHRLWVLQHQKLFFTPLFIALIVIELTDLIFAFDSLPAIFAITTDPYLIFTSNFFAILGLRSLYFSISPHLHRLKYLHKILGVLLILIGLNLFIPLIFPHPSPLLIF